MRRWIAALLLLALPVRAFSDTNSSLCTLAGQHAEIEFRLPPGLLGAIGRVESGGRGQDGSPWPWTIQAGGAGAFFDTRAEAMARITRLQAQGVQVIDVGCFQVDLFWHPGAFASINEALDPERNARAAARFLAALHEQTLDWSEAVARYHSATPRLGAAYRDRVLADGSRSHPEHNPTDYDPFVIVVGHRRNASALSLPHIIRAGFAD